MSSSIEAKVKAKRRQYGVSQWNIWKFKFNLEWNNRPLQFIKLIEHFFPYKHAFISNEPCLPLMHLKHAETQTQQFLSLANALIVLGTRYSQFQKDTIYRCPFDCQAHFQTIGQDDISWSSSCSHQGRDFSPAIHFCLSNPFHQSDLFHLNGLSGCWHKQMFHLHGHQDCQCAWCLQEQKKKIDWGKMLTAVCAL